MIAFFVNQSSIKIIIALKIQNVNCTLLVAVVCFDFRSLQAGTATDSHYFVGYSGGYQAGKDSCEGSFNQSGL